MSVKCTWAYVLWCSQRDYSCYVFYHVARLPGDSIRLSKDEQVPISEENKKQTENFILTVSILFKVHMASQRQHTGSYTGLQNKGKVRADAEV